MEYIIKNKNTGKVEHYCQKDEKLIPKNAIKIKGKWCGISGEDSNFYDDNGERFSENELVEKGLLEDSRGTYYTRNKHQIEIKNINQKIPDNCIKEKWNHITDKLVDGKWIEQKEEKEKYNLSREISENESYLFSTDWYVLRELESGKVIPKNIKERREKARKRISDNRIKLGALNDTKTK